MALNSNARAVLKSPIPSASTTSFSKKQDTTPAIVPKPTTTSGDPMDATQRNSGTIRGVITRHLKKREKGQPFFTVYNIGDSHESRGSAIIRDESVDPKKMILAPYHPDLPEMRNTYAKYASAIYPKWILWSVRQSRTSSETTFTRIQSSSTIPTTVGYLPEAKIPLFQWNPLSADRPHPRQMESPLSAREKARIHHRSDRQFHRYAENLG